MDVFAFLFVSFVPKRVLVGVGHWPQPEDGISLAVTGPFVREIEDRHENDHNKTVYVQSINGYQEKASSGSRTTID